MRIWRMNFHFVLGLVEDSARRPDGGGDVLHRVTEPDLLGQAGGLHTTVNMWSKVLFAFNKKFLGSTGSISQVHTVLPGLVWWGSRSGPPPRGSAPASPSSRSSDSRSCTASKWSD